ncbi:MAG: carboxymuconolactone decarboxylase family protein [Gammaproteobacteria bacterium]
MSVVDTPNDYRFAWYIRPLLALIRWRRGRIPYPVMLWARMPIAFIGFQMMLRALERDQSPLDAKLRALVRTRIAQINHCHFCIDLNAANALERGVTQQQVDELADFRNSSHFSAAEKVALEYTEVITASAIDIGSGLARRLHDVFSDDAIVELAAVVSHQNLSAKFNAALGVAAEGYCPVPPRKDK